MNKSFLRSSTVSVSEKMPEKFPGIESKESDMEVLMHRVLNENDYQAFELLFNKMYAPLCDFSVRFVEVREVAEELVSDVFYTIWQNRSRIMVSAPKAYLYTAVRNRAFDHLRKIKGSLWYSLEHAEHIAAGNGNHHDVMVENELHQNITRSIANLPRQCKVIFELSRNQGLKYREIAIRLNISIKTVETQMTRALKQLREAIPA